MATAWSRCRPGSSARIRISRRGSISSPATRRAPATAPTTPARRTAGSRRSPPTNASSSSAARAELLAAAHDADRVRVVLTLRDDFLMRLQRLPGLGARLTTGIHLLGTPSRADLRRILLEPARRVGYDYEDVALVDEMVAAV